MAESTDAHRPNRPQCGHEGCDLPVTPSADGETWFHWVNDPADLREYAPFSKSPVQRTGGRGGIHDAKRPVPPGLTSR